jgi:hypothetical protein
MPMYPDDTQAYPLQVLLVVLQVLELIYQSRDTESFIVVV